MQRDETLVVEGVNVKLRERDGWWTATSDEIYALALADRNREELVRIIAPTIRRLRQIDPGSAAGRPADQASPTAGQPRETRSNASSRAVRDPDGHVYPSIASAARALDLSNTQFLRHVSDPASGWSWVAGPPPVRDRSHRRRRYADALARRPEAGP